MASKSPDFDAVSKTCDDALDVIKSHFSTPVHVTILIREDKSVIKTFFFGDDTVTGARIALFNAANSFKKGRMIDVK